MHVPQARGFFFLLMEFDGPKVSALPESFPELVTNV